MAPVMPNIYDICPKCAKYGLNGTTRRILRIVSLPGQEHIGCGPLGSTGANWIHQWSHQLNCWTPGMNIIHFNQITQALSPPAISYAQIIKQRQLNWSLGEDDTSPGTTLAPKVIDWSKSKYPGFCPRCGQRAYVGALEVDHLRGGSKCLSP